MVNAGRPIVVPDFGCPDEDLVVLKMLYVFSRFLASYRNPFNE